MNPEEIKRYFKKNAPPQDIAWKPWANITDTRQFLNSCYVAINDFQEEYRNLPFMMASREFYQDMLVLPTKLPIDNVTNLEK